jgi:hypothetical protein
MDLMAKNELMVLLTENLTLIPIERDLMINGVCNSVLVGVELFFDTTKIAECEV